MIRAVSKNYTWGCARLPYCSAFAAFRSFTLQSRAWNSNADFPPHPGGPDTHLLFTGIYIHIPRMAAGGWGRDVLTVKRTVLPRELKVLLSCLWEMRRQGGWLLRWLPWRQWWGRQGCGSLPFSLSMSGGTGRKSVWLVGRRTRGDSSMTSWPRRSSLLPPVSRHAVSCPSFPRWGPPSTLFSRSAALPR